MQLPLDAIDDLRLAVDEAVTLLLMTSRGASRIEMRLDPSGAELTATVGTDAPIDRGLLTAIRKRSLGRSSRA